LDLLNEKTSTIKRVHLMGIGGAGMSGLALLLKELGYEVSGCDVNRTSYVDRVIEKGIDFVIGHEMGHLEAYSPDLLIYSSAIPDQNEELLEAFRREIIVAKRADVLSWLFNSKKGIGIAGTHGKTTTSSMIAMILEQAGLEPTVAIGGELCDIGVNAKLGSGPYMVAELDESDGSFEGFAPEITVVTNADWDHVDHYPDIMSVLNAYQRFMANTKDGGSAIVCCEDSGIRKLFPLISSVTTTETYGFGTGWGWGACNIVHLEGGGVLFSVYHQGKEVCEMKLSISGDHNILNSLAAIIVARRLNIPFSLIQETLHDFRGAKRRLQYMGHIGKAELYDDYGHHPREIEATLNTLRQMFPQKRHMVVFQPHRYTRTKAMYKEFAEVLSMADLLYIMPIYPADEKPMNGVTSKLISDTLGKYGYSTYHLCSNFSEASSFILSELQPNDLLITIGAGNVTRVGEMVQTSYVEGD